MNGTRITGGSSKTRCWAGAALSAILLYGCAKPVQAPPAPTSEDTLSRLLKLEDERSDGDGEVVLRLEDPVARVRARAAVVLARLDNPEAATHLTNLLSDPTDFVRENAAFALGSLTGPLPPETIDALVLSLDDDTEDENVRARVIEALGRKGGERAPEVIATALARTSPRGGEPYEWVEDMETSSLSYSYPDLRAGMFALAGASSLRWTWALIATEGSTPRYVWWPAAWAASELEGDQLAPIMRFFAGSRDPEFRLWGARGYASLRTEGVAQHVRILMADPSERVRIAAIRAAAAQNLTEVVPQLVARLGDDTRYVQTVALEALSALEAPMAIEPLIDQLGSDSYWVRSLALPALARQDIEGFWLLLAGLGDDPDWQVRAALADLLGRIQGPRPAQLLLSIAEESDARVRARALRALTVRDPETATPVLISHLKGADPFERLVAAQMLAETGASEGAVPLHEAFLLEDGAEPRVKAELLHALARLDPDLAETTARSALDDQNFLVRRAAAKLVNRSAESPATARPLSSDHGMAFYRPLVNPRYSPQAFIRTRGGATIEVELFVLDAPLTVQNFIRLARSGFYDGLTVHEVVPNAFIKTGDPRGDGNGGPGYAIRSERNMRPVVRGTVAMVEHGPDTGGSQILVTQLPQPQLESRVTVFGQVTSGMNAIDRMEPGDVIESVTIWDGYTSPYRER